MKIVSRKQALIEGLNTYYTGKACSNGHIAKRNIKYSQCLECIATRTSREHKKLINEVGKEKAEEIIRERARLRSKKHRERAGDKATKYMREYMREYKKTVTGAEALERARTKYANKEK